MSSPRFVHVHYCDDIRQEINGKLSLIGCYGPDLVVNQRLPVVLPKLCAMVFVVTPISTPFRALKVRILRDQELITEIEVPDENFAAMAADVAEGMRLFQLSFQFAFAPFAIPEEGVLSVEAQTETELLVGNRLRLRVEPAGLDIGTLADGQ